MSLHNNKNKKRNKCNKLPDYFVSELCDRFHLRPNDKCNFDFAASDDKESHLGRIYNHLEKDIARRVSWSISSNYHQVG